MLRSYSVACSSRRKMPQRSRASHGPVRQSFLCFSSLTSRLRGVTSSSRAGNTKELEANPMGGGQKNSNGSQIHQGQQQDEQCVLAPGTTATAAIFPVVMRLQAGSDIELGTSCFQHDARGVDRSCTSRVTTGRTARRSNQFIQTNKFLLLPPTNYSVDTTFSPVLHQETAQICESDVSFRGGVSARDAEELTVTPLQCDTSLFESGVRWLPESKTSDVESSDRAFQNYGSASSSSCHTDTQEPADEKPDPAAPQLPRRAAAAGKLSGRHECPFEEKCRLFLNGDVSASSLAEWGVGTTCRKGLKESNTNQDDFFVYCCDEWGLYGVFDGHGPGGHFVSNFVQWHLPTLIHDQISAREPIPQALTKSFLHVNKMLKEASEKQNFDAASSGTTASVVFHLKQEHKLFIAHVGDSKIVLATFNKDGHLVAERLTKEHRPNDRVEKRRIEACGGEVRRPAGHVPYRVFVKGKNYPGLAMSRSIGDSLGHTAGVTAHPDIMERMVVEGIDKYLIMCSDGVWEFISDQEAVDIISRFPAEQVDMAVAKLTSLAWKRWVDRQRHSVDDITAQVIHLFPPVALHTSPNPKIR